MAEIKFAAWEPHIGERPLRGMRAITSGNTEGNTLRALIEKANETLEPGRWYILKRLPAPADFGPNYIQLGWDELPGDPTWTWDGPRGCWTTNATMVVGR